MSNVLEQILKKERICPRILENHAEKQGNKVLLKYEDKCWTYQEVDTLANRIGNQFSKFGINKGDHVLIMLPNVPEFIFAFLGLTKIGGVEVPVNTAYKGNLLKHVINDSKATTMIVHENYLENLRNILPDLNFLNQFFVYGNSNLENIKQGFTNWKIRSFKELLGPNTSRPDVELKGNDVMAIMYTSGTTGKSKGVVLTYYHAYSYIGLESKTWFKVDDCFYLPLPLFHVGGQWAGFYTAMAKGAQVALFPKFSRSRFWEHINEYGCTVTLLLGAMANFLWEQPERDNDGQNPLRVVTMVPLIENFEMFAKRFQLQIATSYGSTESSMPIHTFPIPNTVTSASYCGKVRCDYEIQVVDENDNPLPPGKIGEVCVRPKIPWTIMSGYYNLPAETLKSWRNLWFHTGDAMYYDEEGNYYFVDRVNDSIRRRGENISSAEVEAEVLSHPYIFEAAAVAVPSEYSEDEIKIVVVFKPDCYLDHKDLHLYLKGRMPYFMVPRYIEYKTSILKTPTEKIRKNILRQEGITSNTWDSQVFE
ncbi:AMP-binding protein [Bacillus dakarensis]|uniref:AMP-binding protein n=1 Tax=Robertmurraya dakarensis TaxID=1926278 RepID=UPI000981CB77|nr:AMP-binding protein [Bacillus dakarensis]